MLRSGIIASSLDVAAPVDGYISTNGSTANSTTYTFTSQAIGTAAANRRVIVGVSSRDTLGAPSSVTVGGTALTQDVYEQNSNQSMIYSEVIPTGTTATIVVTYPASNTFTGIGVWVVYGKSAVATAKNTANSATPVATLTTVSGDFCVAMIAYRATVTTPSWAFSNGSVNERFDVAVDGAVRMHAGGDVIASGTSTAMGGTVSNYNAESTCVAVAYR